MWLMSTVRAKGFVGALLAEHGIPVTEEGVARARAKPREADQRFTSADWERLRHFIDVATL
jgi:hypothetical protein